MFNRSSKPTPPPFGAMEFELTDFDEARQALDELPAGIAALAQAGGDYWAGRRRPASPSDRALTGATVDWIVGLPPALRPRLLSQQFPRLGNHLAEVWAEPVRALQAVDTLLIDRRGGRRGLPQAVQGELQALREHLERSMQAPTSDPEMLRHARRLLEAAGYRVIAPGG